ncbi:MAG: hypothetical protein ABI425_04685 [Patescibacteria group bacterium]
MRFDRREFLRRVVTFSPVLLTLVACDGVDVNSFFSAVEKLSDASIASTSEPATQEAQGIQEQSYPLHKESFGTYTLRATVKKLHFASGGEKMVLENTDADGVKRDIDLIVWADVIFKDANQQIQTLVMPLMFGLNKKEGYLTIVPPYGPFTPGPEFQVTPEEAETMILNIYGQKGYSVPNLDKMSIGIAFGPPGVYIEGPNEIGTNMKGWLQENQSEESIDQLIKTGKVGNLRIIIPFDLGDIRPQ